MNVIKRGLYMVMLAAVSQATVAAPFAHEARSLSMGNIGVATADVGTAPFANPAMLSFQEDDDDFSLLLSVGGFFSDNEDMIDDIDRFQDASAASDAAEMLSIAQQLDGKLIAPEASAAIAIGFSAEKYAMAISARSDVITIGGLTNVSMTEAEAIDPSFNILNVNGIKTTEVGFSIARNFELMNTKVSIGLTPKIVTVEVVEFSESIITVDTGLKNLIDNTVEDLGDFTTLDLGIVIGLTDNIQLGLAAKNLITEEIVFIGETLSFDTELKVGVAYSGDIVTIGTDIDLTENNSALPGGMKRQNLSVGLELNAFDFAQLRVGVMKNIADDLSSVDKKPIYTAGIGFWLGFKLDVAVMSGEGDSLGAFVQTGFIF